jgi:hypothetical protein
MTMDFHRLARFMFNRQAEHYDADPEEANLAWMDPGVQAFWRNEAAAVLGYIRRDEWADDAEDR